MMHRVVFGLVFGLGIVACAAQQKTQESAVASVWMQKPDGSKMCGFKEGTDPEKMAAQLKSLGISVLQAKKGSDGMMHTMMCGGPTGDTVDIEVPAVEANKVKKLGFKLKQ